MKSGSSRGMPTPPTSSTDCGTSSSTEIFCPSPCGLIVGTATRVALRRQSAEHLVDQPAGGGGIDVADDRDLEGVAGEHPSHVALEVGRGDGGHRFERAAHRPAIGMARKGGRPPALGRHLVGARGLAAQPRHDLLADAIHVDGVEMRFGEPEPQQLGRLVQMGGQRAHRAGGLVAVGREAELDRLRRDALMERLGIEVARAFVDQRRRHVGDARLVRGILAGAAAKREVERDQWHRMLLDEPRLDAGRADDAFDGGGVGGGREHQRRREREGGGEGTGGGNTAAVAGNESHERFSGAGSSLTR